MRLKILVVNYSTLCTTLASMGDESQYFKTCTTHCDSVQCKSGQYLRFLDSQSLFQKDVLGWDCQSECQYKCMIQTVDYFKSEQNIMPRFYKWFPLRRIYGVRQPMAVLFLLFLFICQIKLLWKFISRTPKSAPIRSIVIHQGIFSIIGNLIAIYYHACTGGGNNPKNAEFHKTNKITGLILALTTTFILLHFIYFGVYRFLWRKMPAEVKSVWYIFLISFTAYSIACTYITIPQTQLFLTNLVLFIFGSTLWSFFSWRYRSMQHTWKIILFLFISASSFVFQIDQFPALYLLLDAHACFIMILIPLPIFWYGFCYDDAHFLYREMSAFKIE